MANTSIEIILKMPFFSLSNLDVKFAILEKLTWRSYTTVKALPTTNWVKLINKREFAKVASDENLKTLVMYIATLVITKADSMKVYLFQVF